ncbi:MAG: DegT/DnrJ/EryC1/StrS family aminotransferase [Polyangiales bacterium]
MSDVDRIPVCAPVFSDKERAYVLEAVESGWISSTGAFLGRFESAFARFCGVRHVESCANGTTALHLVLHAIGVGRGDEVIVPSFTFAASANPILFCGATPVFCEIDPTTWVMDVDDALSRVTPKTRAIVGVDLFGVVVDYDALRAGLARMGRSDVKLVEDAAEAAGTSMRGRRAGSLGDAAIFSFFGNKTLTTGEGGAVATDDEALGARVRFLKNHGMDARRRYFHPELGFNYRMTNLQAAVGCAQVEAAEDLCARKRRVHARYRARLERVEGLHFQHFPSDQEVVPWLVAIVDDALPSDAARDRLLAAMSDRGVDGRPFFVPCHLFPYFPKPSTALPISERIAAHGLALPSGGGLTDAQIDRACDVLLDCRAAMRAPGSARG